MATHDYILSNQSGSSFRSDLNNALAAIVSQNSNATEPATTYSYQYWIDTSATPALIKQRNAANDAWVTLAEVDGQTLAADGTTAKPGISFAADINCGLRRNAADDISIITGGTQAITVDSSQNVGVGSTGPEGKLHLRADGDEVKNLLFLHNRSSGGSASSQIASVNAANGFSDDRYAYMRFITTGAGQNGNHITFGTNVNGSGPQEEFRITDSGYLLKGHTAALTNFRDSQTTANRSPMLQITGTSGPAASLALASFSTAEPGYYSPQLWLGKSHTDTLGGNGVVSSSEDLGAINFAGNDGTNFINAASIRAEADGTCGTNDMPGRLVFYTTPNSSATPTEVMRCTQGGQLLVGTTSTAPGDQTSGGGAKFDENGCHVARAGATPLLVNRTTNDGTLVSFRRLGTQQGSISVSGNTVSYNGAHLSRWSQLAGGAERVEILRGSVLSNLDEMCEWAYDAQGEVLYTEEDELPEGASVGDVKTPARDAGTEDNEQLNRMKVSDVEGDPNVAGVFQSWDDDDEIYTNDFYCAMTGDFVIRIAQGTTVARGDLLISAGYGTAKPQDDDIVRSKTVAKVTSTVVSETYADGSYCIPCVLMAC